jgi:hypothetical protein
MLETCKFYIGFGGNHVEFYTSLIKEPEKPWDSDNAGTNIHIMK